MGRSLGAPRGPSGTFFDAAAKTRFTIKSSASGMVQQIERRGASSDYSVAYSIGSGLHAIGYLIEIENHLFQSPIAYYPGRGWGMAPGYENARDVDFYRPVAQECLVCHSGIARPVSGTLNTYQNPPFAAQAITCSRCHGPTQAHLRDPAPGSIVNPASLPPRARDSVCEQCHLKGDARVANPGKSFSDFRPGQALENTFTVYLFASKRNPRSVPAFKVISQSQQLALSMCSRMSHGKLWCGTCHNPHRLPKNPVAYFRSRCLSCHGQSLLKTHPKPNENCISCHMPRLPVVNGNHTIFTDHRIAIYPPQQRVNPSRPKSKSINVADAVLVPWHKPPTAYAQRNLALAEIQAGRRLKSLPLLNRGFRRLLSCWSHFPNDPATLTALGETLYDAGKYKAAEEVYTHLIQIQPRVAMNYLRAGLVWEAADNTAAATSDLKKALQLDPLLPQPYWQLARIYYEASEPEKARQIFDQYRKTFPRDIDARLAAGKP